jgi:hypothetical protein
MTLNEITRDILNIARGANVSQSETIQIREIEFWVHQYRSRLIRQSIDKSNIVPDQWIQEINCMELETVDKASCDCVVSSDCMVQRTILEVPKFIATGSTDGLIFVGTITGKPYQITTPTRSYYSKYKKWSGSDRMAYIRNNHIYVTHAIELQYISIAGIFEDPVALASYTDCSGSTCFDINTFEYPISTDMIPIIKEMIFKNELGIMLQMPSDKNNDERNILTPNAIGTQK